MKEHCMSPRMLPLATLSRRPPARSKRTAYSSKPAERTGDASSRDLRVGHEHRLQLVGEDCLVRAVPGMSDEFTSSGWGPPFRTSARMSGMSGRAFTRPTTNRTSRVYIWAFGDALVRQAEARVRIEATLGQGLTPLHCPVVPR